MAKACNVSGTLDSGLTQSEVPDESETQFSEEQELEQLINGQLCFKMYPFSKGRLTFFLFLNRNLLLLPLTMEFYHYGRSIRVGSRQKDYTAWFF